MITIPALHEAVCNFMQEKVASRYMLRTKAIDENGEPIFKSRNPIVIRSGWILPRKVGGIENPEEIYPYITPRIWKVENIPNERESVVTLDIHYGVFDPGSEDESKNLILDGSGYRDFWNLVETTRQAFFSNPTIDNKFRILEDFFESGMIDEQVYPYYEGHCRTKWHVNYPMPQLEEHLFYK